MPFFSTRRRVRNENLTSLRGGARMLKSCQLLRLEKTLQNSRISCQNRAKAGWWAWYTYFFTSLVKRLMMFCWQNIFYKIWTRVYGFQKTWKKRLQTVPWWKIDFKSYFLIRFCGKKDSIIMSKWVDYDFISLAWR